MKQNEQLAEDLKKLKGENNNLHISLDDANRNLSNEKEKNNSLEENQKNL